MQQSQPILVLRCHVSGVPDEKWSKMQITPSGRLIQLSVPVFVLGVLNKEACET